MSAGERRPSTPVRRPDTARPRRETAEEEPSLPSHDELEGIERHLAMLTEIGGATLDRDAEAAWEAWFVEWPRHGPAFNHAAVIRWTGQTWAERSASVAIRSREAGEIPAVIVAEGLSGPADLSTRLRARGWVSVARETVLWTRRAGVVPHLDPTLRLEAVTPATASAYETVERRIFGLPDRDGPDRAAALTRALDQGRVRAYLVRLRGEAVATARMSPFEGLAALQGVGVLPRHRRQGLGTLITTVATRAGLATGNSLVWLSVREGNEPGLALYQGLDYRPAFSWEMLVEPGGA